MGESTKLCKKCGREQPRDAFSPNRAMKDGLSFYCTLCMRQIRQAWSAAHPERVREHNHRWKQAHRAELATKERERRLHRQQQRTRDR